MSTQIAAKKRLAKHLLISSLILAFLVPILAAKSIFSIFIIILSYLFIIAVNFPLWGLFLLIILRPILDYFTDEAVLQIFNQPINLAAILGVFTIIFAFIQVLKQKFQIYKYPLFPLWFLFLAISFVSIGISINPAASLAEWLRLLSLFSIFILGYVLINSREDLSRLSKAVVFSALIPALFGFWQFITKSGVSLPMEGIHNRIYGTFAHPNLLAYYLIIPITMAILIYLFGKKFQIPKLLYLLAAIVLTLILALTFTRGAWAAFLLVVLIIGAFRYRVFAAGILAVLLLSYLAVPTINTRVNDLFRPDEYSSITWRLGLWQDSLGYAKERPLLGYGAGTASQVILDKRGEQAGSPDPHNDFLKIALDSGLFGLASYSLLLLGLFFELARRLLKEKLPKLKTFILATIALGLAIFTMSLADNIIRNTALQWIFWALAGGLLAVSPTRIWDRTLN